jgi:hypothetical protein
MNLHGISGQIAWFMGLVWSTQRQIWGARPEFGLAEGSELTIVGVLIMVYLINEAVAGMRQALTPRGQWSVGDRTLGVSHLPPTGDIDDGVR